MGASETLSVPVGGVLFAYVYLDPENPPRQLMLQFNVESCQRQPLCGLADHGPEFIDLQWFGQVGIGIAEIAADQTGPLEDRPSDLSP